MYMIFSRKNHLDFVEYFEVCETSKKNAYVLGAKTEQ